MSNIAEAIVFARHWHQATRVEHLTLTAIDPDSPRTTTQTFTRAVIDAVLPKWIGQQIAAGRNVYFQPNETPPNCVVKPAKADMIAALCRHADIDPASDLPLAEERLRLLALAERLAGDPDFAPTAIIDSGGGIQCLWACERQLPPAGTWDAVEAQNREIEAALGAGGTHDVSRLLRMPGTTNYPSQSKRNRGRVVAPASLIHRSDRVYAHDEIDGLIPAWRQRMAATELVILKGNATGSRLGTAASGRQGDLSRSGRAFRMAGPMRAFGGTFEAWLAALEEDPELAAWKAEKGEVNDGRELRRTWERAGVQPAQAGAWGQVAGPDRHRDDTAPAFSEEALALEFARRHGAGLRYVAAWNEWRQLHGTVWRRDDSLAAMDLVRQQCREAARACGQPEGGGSRARQLASEKTVRGVERLARADRRLSATPQAWDPDPWLLNTPGGVVDLRTGQSRPSSAEDMMTKTTPVGPGGECPTWRRFLDRITDSNVPLQAYLQRVAGYAVTGSTKEHALFFCYGTGANGKSVFLNTLVHVMGDYATVADMAVFTGNNEQHPTGLASLRGARLVVANETEEGSHLAEARLKAISGGDPITARFMRQDHFTFTPTCKVVIAGNHQPALRNVDAAMRRRFSLVPFNVTIPPHERDRELPDKLRAEAGGILEWMIDGALAWQREGLNPPSVVRAASEDYLTGQDTVGLWLEECCDLTPGGETLSTALWKDFEGWVRRAGEAPGTQKRLSLALLSRGFAKTRDVTGKAAFQGIRLKPSAGWPSAA